MRDVTTISDFAYLFTVDLDATDLTLMPTSEFLCYVSATQLELAKQFSCTMFS